MKSIAVLTKEDMAGTGWVQLDKKYLPLVLRRQSRVLLKRTPISLEVRCELANVDNSPRGFVSTAPLPEDWRPDFFTSVFMPDGKGAIGVVTLYPDGRISYTGPEIKSVSSHGFAMVTTSRPYPTNNP